MEEVSVIIQGNLREETPAVLRAARAGFPRGQIILSTWKGEARLPEFDLCDAILELDDPGPILAPDVFARNLRRQCVSAHAGLAKASHPWVIKSRTDVILQDCDYLSSLAGPTLGSRIGVWRNFTADAARNSCLFLVSDLLQVGHRHELQDYWPDTIPDDAGFSGMIPEQWLFLHYLQKKGEIPQASKYWLKTGFAQVHRHHRAMAKYVRILPAEIAVLPARLRNDGCGLQNRDLDGSLLGSFSIFRNIKYREIRSRLGKLKRRLVGGVSRSAAT